MVRAVQRYINPRVVTMTQRTDYLTSGTVTNEGYINDWIAPAQPEVHVEMDVGGRRLRGRATSCTEHANGWTLRNVQPQGWYWHDDDDATNGHGWPSTATTASTTGGRIWLRANTVTGTANTFTITSDTTTASTDVVIFGPDAIRASMQPIARLQRRLPQLTNHRGEPVRSEHKGTAWSEARPEELIALQLLRKMVTPDAFKHYLKHHFVSVTGPSGLVYQIGRSELIKVWDAGELVATLCVHLKDWYGKPPTDEVVAKMIIAECDEPDLWKRSNKVFRVPNTNRPRLRAVGAA